MGRMGKIRGKWGWFSDDWDFIWFHQSMGMVCESKVVSSMPETAKYEWFRNPFLILLVSLWGLSTCGFSHNTSNKTESTAMKHCYEALLCSSVVLSCSKATSIFPAPRSIRWDQTLESEGATAEWDPCGDVDHRAFRGVPKRTFFDVNCHSLPGLSGTFRSLKSTCHMLTMLTVTVKHCGVGLFLRHGLTLGRGCAREGIPVRGSWFYVASRAQWSFSSILEIYLKPMEPPLKKMISARKSKDSNLLSFESVSKCPNV